MGNIRSYKELRVYQASIDAAMAIFEVAKTFPSEEKFAMVDQMRRSSRSVSTNIAEAWRKGRYPARFKSKLSDAESEAAETRVWIELAMRCKYIDQQLADELDRRYDKMLGQLVSMIVNAHKWTIQNTSDGSSPR